MTPLRIFIGWDSREPIAFSVLAHSILRRASVPVSITPLTLASLKGVYTRERGPTESTEFSLTRFLVPYLSDYEGWSMFMDCDMLCQFDMGDMPLVVPSMIGRCSVDVFVVQHDYTPRSSVKFLNQPQTVYPRKNWSSVMLFNNTLCKALTPEYVNTASGLALHRFMWTSGRIGYLPVDFNWLVGEYEPHPNARILHWTNGGPWFPEYADCDHADLWWAEHDHMMGTAQYRATAMMG